MPILALLLSCAASGDTAAPTQTATGTTTSTVTTSTTTTATSTTTSGTTSTTAPCVGLPNDEPTDFPPQWDTLVNVTSAPKGDVRCFQPGTWLCEEPDPLCQVSTPGTVRVVDALDGSPQAERKVKAWDDGTESGTPLVDGRTNADGTLSADVAACTVYNGLIEPQGTTTGWLETRSYTRLTDGPDLVFQMASEAFYDEVLDSLDLEYPSTGLAFGVVRDCAGQPLENVQVVARKQGGSIPDEVRTRYLRGDAVSTSATTTGSDGRYVVANLSNGGWNLEVWGWNGTTQQRYGLAYIRVDPGSVSISNVDVGFDRTNLPEDCASCP